jgi:hypothetical protein
MNIEQFVDKTDLLLYKRILNLIMKDWDGMETDKLSELLSKLKELHDNLDKVIIQRKQQDLFDKHNYNSQFDRNKVKEDVRQTSMSLKNIYTEIKDKRKFRVSVSN